MGLTQQLPIYAEAALLMILADGEVEGRVEFHPYVSKMPARNVSAFLPTVILRSETKVHPEVLKRL